MAKQVTLSCSLSLSLSHLWEGIHGSLHSVARHARHWVECIHHHLSTLGKGWQHSRLLWHKLIIGWITFPWWVHNTFHCSLWVCKCWLVLYITHHCTSSRGCYIQCFKSVQDGLLFPHTMFLHSFQAVYIWTHFFPSQTFFKQCSSCFYLFIYLFFSTISSSTGTRDPTSLEVSHDGLTNIANWCDNCRRAKMRITKLVKSGWKIHRFHSSLITKLFLFHTRTEWDEYVN